jgi:CO dehydrogenase maturation factor
MVLGKGFTIAVAGKGGVGKTNIAALLIRYLSRKGSVLAIDADPDSNLPQALGVTAAKTVGQVREAILHAPTRSSIAVDKRGALERALYEVVEEDADFDLVAMGRSEGSGCYCGVNSLISQVIDTRADAYNFTVIDSEAGLEHLSRRTARDVDLMIVITDPTTNGVLTAKRVKELSTELCVDFGEMIVVANRVTPETKPIIDKIAKDNGLNIDAYVPYDRTMSSFDTLGRPVTELPDDSPASMAVAAIGERILNSAIT